jgi:hypothetical protein
MKEEKEKIVIQPIIAPKTRQQTAKLKERSETNKLKTRSRTTSENVLPENRTNISTSPPPPPPPLQINTALPHSSISTSRPRIHSPSHMPYPLRSPRTRQHRAPSPVHFTSPPTTRTSGMSS